MDVQAERFKEPFNLAECFERICRSGARAVVSPSVDGATDDAQTPQHPWFDATPLLASVRSSIEQLWQLQNQLAEDAQRLEANARRQEEVHRQHLAASEKEVEHASEGVDQLEEGIQSVANKIVKVGEELQTHKAKRDRAADALVIMRHMSTFANMDQKLLSPFNGFEVNLEDPNEKDHEVTWHQLKTAASLIQTLHYIVTEVTRNSKEVEAARARVLFVYDDVQRKLLMELRRALDDEDRERLKEVADVIFHFSSKVYKDAVKVFVEFYLDKHYNVFEDPLQAAVELAEKIHFAATQVFPNVPSVMSVFLQSLLHGPIKNYIASEIKGMESAPSTPRSPSSARFDKTGEAADSDTDETRSLSEIKRITLKALDTIATLFTETLATMNKIVDTVHLGMDEQTIEASVREVFGPFIQSHIKAEVDGLMAAYDALMEMFYQEVGHERRSSISKDSKWAMLGQGHGQTRDVDSTETLLSQSVAVGMLHENNKAMERCEKIAPPPLLPDWIYRVYCVLVDGLCSEHISHALEMAKLMLPPRKPKNEPSLDYLFVVSDANSIFYLFQMHFQNSVSPRLQNSLVLYPAALSKKNQVMERLEGMLASGLDILLTSCLEWSKHLLAKMQQKTEFKPSNPELTVEATLACRSVCTFLGKVAGRLHSNLNGKNLQACCRALGGKFHSALLDHIRSFQYNPEGGLQLFQDVQAYFKCMQLYKDPLLDDLFETLCDLAKLVFVEPANIKQITREGRMAKLEPAVIQSFLQLRSDYKAEKIASRYKDQLP